MPVVEKTLRLPYADLYVRMSEGSGWPILLLHGSGASSQVFRKQLESPLGEQFQLIALDLPGHGRSSDAENARSDYGIVGLASTVRAALRQLGIVRPIIYGWSLGGHVAIQILHETPEHVAGLMISGAPPVSPGPLGMLRGFHASWDMLLASKESFSPRDVERFEQLCFGDQGTPEFADMIRRADGRARVEFVRSMMRAEGADQRRVVETAVVPVALVNGADEPIARLSYLASLNIMELWENRPHVIAGAGHAPFWQAPDEFNSLLARFADAVVAHEAIGEALARRANLA